MQQSKFGAGQANFILHCREKQSISTAHTILGRTSIDNRDPIDFAQRVTSSLIKKFPLSPIEKEKRRKIEEKKKRPQGSQDYVVGRAEVRR